MHKRSGNHFHISGEWEDQHLSPNDKWTELSLKDALIRFMNENGLRAKGKVIVTMSERRSEK